MSKFWQKKYISKYTGAEIDAAVEKAGDLSKVEANPTLAGTEAALTGLEVGETKYKVEQPINVVANPTLAGTEAALTGLQVGETKYKVLGKEDFVVTITLTGIPATPTAAFDKTYAEIEAAQTAGKNIIFKVNVVISDVTVMTVTTMTYFYSTVAHAFRITCSGVSDDGTALLNYRADLNSDNTTGCLFISIS